MASVIKAMMRRRARRRRARRRRARIALRS
jgi:hypothetical protein